MQYTPKQIAHGIYGILKAKLNLDPVSDKLKYNRMTICCSCEQIEYKNDNLVNAKCSECGCYLKYKIALDSEKCPLNKW